MTNNPHVFILSGMEALKSAIERVGSQSRLASILGVTPQGVHNWVLRNRVPADYCPAIEKATDGAVRCEDLRPDVDWGYLRGTGDRSDVSSGRREVPTAAPVECASGDPRHGIDRRQPDQRLVDRRKECGDA